MSAKIENFQEMPSESCEGCPFLQEGGCRVPYRVCWKRSIEGTDFTVKDVASAVTSWICDPLKDLEEE